MNKQNNTKQIKDNQLFIDGELITLEIGVDVPVMARELTSKNKLTESCSVTCEIIDIKRSDGGELLYKLFPDDARYTRRPWVSIHVICDSYDTPSEPHFTKKGGDARQSVIGETLVREFSWSDVTPSPSYHGAYVRDIVSTRCSDIAAVDMGEGILVSDEEYETPITESVSGYSGYYGSHVHDEQEAVTGRAQQTLSVRGSSRLYDVQDNGDGGVYASSESNTTGRINGYSNSTLPISDIRFTLDYTNDSQ